MARIISEEKIHRNLVLIIILAVTVFIFLGLSAYFILSSLDTVQATSADSLTEVHAQSLAQEIQQHIDSDLRSLNIFTLFIDAANLIRPVGHPPSADFLSEALHRLDFPADFFTVTWYSLNGAGMRVYMEGKTVQQVWLSDDNIIAQEAVARAFDGELVTSAFYFDPASQRRILIHAQPVYIEGVLEGVIAGTHGANKIQGFLEAATEGSQQYSYFLADDRGSFIAAASAGRFPEIVYYTQGMETLALPLFPPETRSQIQRVRQGFITVRQEGTMYHGYIQPIAIGDAKMRVICIDSNINAASITNQQLYVTRYVFAVFCATVTMLVIIGTTLTHAYGSRLVHFLYFDTLTGADNINRFRRKLSSRLGKNDYICTATLNVRQFRSVNEIFGVESGNQLLRIVKWVLDKSCKRDEFFCRETGDIFHVCLHESDREAIRKRLEAIMDEVAQAYHKTHDYHVKMYAGAAVFDSASLPETSVSNVFLHLSLALARAKANVSETVCFYEDKLYVQEETQSYIETHMEQALADGSFKMYLQPKMDLASGTIGGAEALVRWAASSGERMIYPDQFIPFFNKNGFCVKLDMYMLEQACSLMHTWIDKGVEPVPISVNQSRLLFFEVDYVDTVSAIAEKYSIPPGLITLEILEEMYLEKMDEVNVKIAELRKRGFLISMDDFGSGYSSFSAIGELSVDELKLDRKFLVTASGTENWRMKIIIDQVVRMARRLHLSVVAEGVETKEDEQLIRTLGCDYGQGYYYSKPIPVEEFNEHYMHSPQGNTEDDDEPFPPELG